MLIRKKELAIFGLAATITVALIFGSTGIATHSWAYAENDSIFACDASIEVHCSLYKRYTEGSYNCVTDGTSSKQDVSDTSDLECGVLDNDSIECTDLTAAQNAAAINLFMLCATLLALAAVYYYKDRPAQMKKVLIASMVTEFVACICAFIAVGSYRSYLEAVSAVDIYFTANTGEKQNIGTLDMDWTYGYSWTLTILSGTFAILCIFISAYFIYSGTFNNKKWANASGMARGDLDDLPTVRNVLGVPLVSEGEESTVPSSNYEL